MNPLPPGHTRPKPRSAEDILQDLLALCAVYEAKRPAHRWIRPEDIRLLIEHGRVES